MSKGGSVGIGSVGIVDGAGAAASLGSVEDDKLQGLHQCLARLDKVENSSVRSHSCKELEVFNVSDN